MSDVFRMRGDPGYLLLHDHSRIHSDRKNTPRQKKLWMFFTRKIPIIEWKLEEIDLKTYPTHCTERELFF